MARTHTDPDGISEVIELFPQGSHKALERMLARARAKEAMQAGHAVQKALRGTAMPNLGMSRLVRELGRALSHRSAGKGRVSVRQVAPGTGGRAFHFAHSVVGKTGGPGSASANGHRANPGTAGGTGAGATRKEPSGAAAAHMRYIERERAVERHRDQNVRSAERDGPERDGLGEGRERDPAQAVHATGAGAGQGYVENPVKLENGELVAFSFGTIGERFEDRVAFWDALEQAEAHPEARVQHRLILELPHEASAAARLEMVRRFCERFESDGVPFWAALHAPGAKNDSRNFHAHVVYSERPAKRMAHPETGLPVWDFEIVRHWIDSSRHARTSRPFRQKKLRAYTALNFIKVRRADFASAVNETLERDKVCDRLGRPVRYDARSYDAMGIEAVPMRSIHRIVADRARDGATTILDKDYTSRMIAAELREAAARRDRDVLGIVALDDAIRAATAPQRAAPPSDKGGSAAASAEPGAAGGRAGGKPPRLPPELRSPNLRSIPQRVLKAAGDRIMAARHEALRNVVMERATTAALERIVEATDPEALGATARGKAGKAAPVPVDVEAARLLREAALEELAEVHRDGAEAKRKTRYRIMAAVQAWREIVNAPSSTMSATTKRILAGISTPARSDGVAAEREASDGSAVRAPTAPRMPAREPAQATPSSEASAPQIRVPAMPAGLHLPLPELKGLPTSPDLAAVSATVSGWIKAIADNVEGADARMAAVDTFYEDLKAMKRAEKASFGLAARSAVQTTRRVDISPNPRLVPEAEGTPTIAADRSDASERAPNETGPADRVAGPTVTGEPDADTERRLKAREEELEKRRKQRKAVLGRRNRGKGVGETGE